MGLLGLRVMLALVLTTTSQSALAQVGTSESESRWSKEEKTWLLNGGAAAALVGYGVLNWDYGQRNPSARSEGWLGRTTNEGGADKLGHFWTSYALSHLFRGIYRSWGYEGSRANAMGALSSLGFQSLMELGDSFSTFGFSYEDALTNVAGATVGYLHGLYPALGEKVDFRVEYIPGSGSDLDVFTDYEHQKYLIAIKGDGFKATRNTPLEYLELQIGMYARGYDSFRVGGLDTRKRTAFIGIGLNVGRFLQPYVDIPFFNYVQMPYTAARIKHRLD